MKSANVILADDHPLMLMAMKAIVEHLHAVIGTCENGKDLVSLVNQQAPDVVITDIDMPELNGIDAATAILAHVPSVKVIFYTAHVSPVDFRTAMKSGAHGYVVKNEPAKTLLAAIECVLNGEQFVSPSIQTVAVAAEASMAHAPSAPDLSTLTPRQLEILQLIGRGASSKQIAHQLNLSVKTVEFHRANLTNRYGRHSIPELLLLAAEQGLIRYPSVSGGTD